MKKITTLLLLFLAFAANSQSNLTIFNNNGQQFYVIFNGIKQNSVPMTNVSVAAIKNGSYSVKLIFSDGKTPDIDKNFMLDEPTDITARVVMKKGKLKLQLISSIPTKGAMTEGDYVIYRPNNSAVYSDASSGNQTVTTQETTTITTTNSTNGNTVNTTNNSQGTTGNTTIQQNSSNQNVTGQNGSVTIQVNGGTTGQQAGQSGQVGMNVSVNGGTTGQQTEQVGMNVSVNGGITGQQTEQVGMNVTVNGGTTGQQTEQVGMNVTVNGGTTGQQTEQVGMNVSVNGGITGQQTEQVGMNVTVNGGITGQQTEQVGMNVTINSQDPNTLNGAVNTSVNVNGNGTTNATNVGTTVTQTTTTTTVTTNGTTLNTNSNQQINNTATVPVTSNASNSNVNATICTKTLGDVSVFVEDINSMTFDDDKKELILKDLKNHCLTAAQTYKIMETLTFEADRLEIAKYLFDRMLDKENGRILLPLFTFDSSKMEFREYMRK
jgi:hypothetical protein